MKYLPTCDVHAAQPVIGFRPRISHLANLCPIFGTFQEQEIGSLKLCGPAFQPHVLETDISHRIAC